MDSGQYGAGERTHVETFPGSLFTRRWFEVTDSGYLWSPFRLAGKPFWECEVEAFCAYCFRAGGKDCSCGFYSYFSRPNPADLYATRGRRYVGAVVENYGKVTYGSRGCRSQKMKIKALVTDTGCFTWSGLRGFYGGDSGLTYLLATIFASLSFELVWCVLALVGVLLFRPADKDLFSRLMLIGYPTGLVLSPAILVGYYWTKIRIVNNRVLGLNDELREDLSMTYQIPIYSSWKEAEKDFPVTTRNDLPSDKED